MPDVPPRFFLRLKSKSVDKEGVVIKIAAEFETEQAEWVRELAKAIAECPKDIDDDPVRAALEDKKRKVSSALLNTHSDYVNPTNNLLHIPILKAELANAKKKATASVAGKKAAPVEDDEGDGDDGEGVGDIDDGEEEEEKPKAKAAGAKSPALAKMMAGKGKKPAGGKKAADDDDDDDEEEEKAATKSPKAVAKPDDDDDDEDAKPAKPTSKPSPKAKPADDDDDDAPAKTSPKPTKPTGKKGKLIINS